MRIVAQGIVRFGPGGEFVFNRPDDVIQMREVPVVQASSTREFPDALDRVQFRALGGEVIEGETIGVLLPPLPVKSGVVVLGVVRNDHHASSASGAGRLQILKKLPARKGVELVGLAPKTQLAVAQTDGTKVSDTAPRRIMQQHAILTFWRDPHAAARTVLLKVHFVHGPKIDSGVKA